MRNGHSSSNDVTPSCWKYAELQRSPEVAIAIPLLATFPLIISAAVCAAAYAYLFSFAIRAPQPRMAAMGLLACMILPCAWVIGFSGLDRILPEFAMMLPGMPSFIPAALIGSWFGQHFQDAQWLTYLLAAGELVIGTWIFRLGAKRTIAYLLLVMHTTASGSLVFYMLCRA